MDRLMFRTEFHKEDFLVVGWQIKTYKAGWYVRYYSGQSLGPFKTEKEAIDHA